MGPPTVGDSRGERVEPGDLAGVPGVRAESVLALLPDGIILKNLDNEIVWANTAAAELFGMSPADMIGARPDDPAFDARHPDGQPFDPQDLPSTKALRTGAAVRGVILDMARASGGRCQVEMSTLPIPRPGGAPGGVVSVVRDVSHRLDQEATARLRAALLGAVGQALVAIDPAGIVIYWNHAAESIYGWSAAEAIGRNVADLFPAAQSRTYVERILAAFAAGEGWSGEYLVRRKDGTTFPALVTGTSLLDADGTLRAGLTVSMDISERKAAEGSMALYTAIVESSSDAMYSTTPEGEIRSWNPAATRLFGYPVSEVLGKHVSVLAPVQRRSEVHAHLAAVRAGDSQQQVHVVRQHRDGSLLDLSLSAAPVRDAQGQVVGVTVTARDIRDQLDLHRRLEHQALHDPLTGLPNRALLDDRLRHALARVSRDGGRVAVLFIDVDGFKNINDASGHHRGDEVLREVARRLGTAVRADDTVARFGGDEFVIVCEDTGLGEAQHVARRCLDALDAPFVAGEHQVRVSASVGIACSPPADANLLLSHADAAMYDAKQRGRARFSIFSQRLATRANERLELSNDLHQALKSDALELHYQPIIDLASGALVGVEALARWTHPRHGAIPPDRFVRIAEESGLIADLDSWVLRRAARDSRVMVERGLFGPDGRVAVNISALHIADANLEDLVTDSASEAGVPLCRLTLEVTETALMTDPDNAVATLRRLRELGVHVKVDDFGVGHSSLSYLKRLPIDGVKIDRAFVRDIAENDDDRAITRTIIDMARALRLQTIAEGVETTEQRDLLRWLGCGAAQGFLWSPARRLDDLLEIVASGAGWPGLADLA